MANAETLATAGRPFGIKNPQRPWGFAHLALAALIAILWLSRLSFSEGEPPSPEPGDSFWAPMVLFLDRFLADFWILLSTIVAAVGFAVHLYAGLNALAFFSEEANAPSDILNGEKSVRELLIGSSVGSTYPVPHGLARLIAGPLPRLGYVTPADSRPAKGVYALIIGLALAPLLFLLPCDVSAVSVSAVVAVIAIASIIRLSAVFMSAPDIAGSHQEIQEDMARGVLDKRTHLTKAGDPSGLYDAVRDLLVDEYCVEKRLREPLIEQRRKVGANSEDNQVDANLVVETHMTLATPEWSGRGNALVLTVGAVILGLVVWALWLFGHRIAGEFSSRLVFLGAALVGGYLYFRLIGLAFSAFNTFRFESDLYWVETKGSWQRTHLGFGGSFDSVKSEREGISSDLRIKLWGTRVVSECCPPSDRVFGHHSGGGALRAPRRLITTVDDSSFTDRFNDLLDMIEDYRDQSGNLTPPLPNENLGTMVRTSAEIEYHKEKARETARSEVHARLQQPEDRPRLEGPYQESDSSPGDVTDTPKNQPPTASPPSLTTDDYEKTASDVPPPPPVPHRGEGQPADTDSQTDEPPALAADTEDHDIDRFDPSEWTLDD